MTRGAQAFRPVPRTGVIYVMAQASERGFSYGAPTWANLGQGAPETGELAGAPARMQAVDIDPHRAEYAPVGGCMELREAVAELYNHRYRRGRGSKYGAKNVAIAAGGRTALTRIATALGPINLGHLLPDYTAYEELLDVFKAFVPLPIVLRADDGFAIEPQTLRDQVVAMGLGAILLSNPCNPTGQRLDEEATERTVGFARELGCTLILDEFYAHYLYSDDGSPIPESSSAAAVVDDVDADPVVIVDGLTKNWRYPGLRLSWTLGPADVIEAVTSAGSFLDGGAPHALQRAAVPLLEPRLAAAEARAIQATFKTKREHMLTRLDEIGIGVPGRPQGAFYCFADLSALPPTLRDGMDFFHAALEREVICVPGAFFDVDPGGRRGHIPSRLRNFVRLSFGPDLEQLERGLGRLKGLVREHT